MVLSTASNELENVAKNPSPVVLIILPLNFSICGLIISVKYSFCRDKTLISSFSTNLEKPTISAATIANNFLSMYNPCHF